MIIDEFREAATISTTIKTDSTSYEKFVVDASVNARVQPHGTRSDARKRENRITRADCSVARIGDNQYQYSHSSYDNSQLRSGSSSDDIFYERFNRHN